MPYINEISEINESDKFIIYKATGGFVHMMTGFMYTIEKCIIMNRILIIDFHGHPAFNRHFSDYFEITDNNLKYSENYDIIPNTYISEEELKIIKKSFIKYEKSGYTFNEKNISKIIDDNSDDNVIFFANYMGPKYYPSNNILKIKDSIIDRLKKTTIPSKKFISLHFRNTDKKNDINKFINLLKKTIQETKINIVYLATDDYYAFDIIKKNLDNNIELLQYCPPINNNGGNIHYGDKDKDRVIYNTLLDMYVILHSTYFIPSKNSGFSKFIMYMINEKNNNIFNIESNTIIYE